MVIGFLLGLALCYAKQIKTLYDNKDKIAATSELGTAIGNFRDAFKF
jgi:hypothetical protein